MIIKQVKEYSNRQRINLNKNDGLEDGQEVVIFSKSDFNDIEMKIQMAELKIDNMKSEIEKLTFEKELLENQQTNLKEIIEDVINPLHEQHQKELSMKDVELNQLKIENTALKSKSNQLCIDFMDLSALQFIFTDKKKVLIDDFNKSISVIIDDATLTNADAKRIDE